MEGDAPVTREEINRIWAELKVLRMLVAHDVGHRWGADRVEAWHSSRANAIEDNSEDPAATAHAIRALDELAKRLRLAS